MDSRHTSWQRWPPCPRPSLESSLERNIAISPDGRAELHPSPASLGPARRQAVTGTIPSLSRELAWSVLGSILATVCVLLAISPLYDTPQMDDWAYRAEVIRFLETGRYVDLGWGDPTMILQVLWGALWAALFGPEYSVLRLSTLSLMPLALVSAYWIFRECGAKSVVAACGAGLLVLQPLSLLLAYSFNSDFPAFALSLTGIALTLRAHRTRSIGVWFAAGLFIASAFLIRQSAAPLIPIALVAAYWSERRSTRRNRWSVGAMIVVPFLAALFVTTAWAPRTLDVLSLSNGPLAQEAKTAASPAVIVIESPGAAAAAKALVGVSMAQSDADQRPSPGTPHTLEIARTAVREFLAGSMTLCLLAFPFLIAGWSLRKSPKQLLGSLLVVLLTAAVFYVARDLLSDGQARMLAGWPYQGDCLSRGGFVAPDIVSRIGSRPVWNALTCTLPWLVGFALARASWLPQLSLAGVRSRSGLDVRTRCALIAVSMGAAQSLILLVAQSFYDRYLSSALLAVLVLASGPLFSTPAIRGSERSSGGHRGRIASLVGLTLLVVSLSLEWTRFQIDRGNAIWSVASDLVDEGFPPEQVGAGFAWNGHHLYLRAVDELGAKPPFDMAGSFPWEPLLEPFQFVVVERREVKSQVVAATYRGFLERDLRYIVARHTGRAASR
ncbi:MAG: glycosyltransferase family 39 protein [Candidatus Eisenbacteria bacterium]|uniref:Glycosyltransferase family 39 protein n=1 Tax=Eiseniibacteriota bacterium TaxID=2212470 RepID=A0A956NGQ1_UNCEI|nr:glycosyltransferase family 39 protein [Candidatus Eisenbacteria bacterium]